MKHAALALSVVALAGCANQPVTVSANDPIVTALTGQPQSVVETKLGLPNKRKDMASGATVWTYIENEKGMTANSCQVIVSIRNETVERVSIVTRSSSMFGAVFTPCEGIRKKLS